MNGADLLELRYVPLSTVRRWDKNPKKHDMGALAAAIERYGFTDPPKYDPALNDGAGGLAHGNGRDECLAWLKAQGKPLPRGIGYRESDKEWLIPVLFGVDAPSQAVAEAYAIDHNNLTMAGGNYTALDMSRMWDESYKDILASLAVFDELPITLDVDDLNLLTGLDALPEAGAGGDEYVDEGGETRAALGDLWVIGGVHRLLVGDCTDPANVARLMGGERARAVVTDSPYGIEREGIVNDDPEGLRALFDGCLDSLPCDDAIVINFQSPRLFPVWLDALRASGHKFERALWMYDENDQTKPWHYWLMCSQIVLISSLGKPQWSDCKAHHDTYVIGLGREWRAGGEGNDYDHASVKPVGVVQDIMAHTTGLIYDPFLGSGTTLIAAHRTGRRCYGCEISPKYADVVLRRAEAEGLTVERIND